ncbi:MAG: disulfide bond formation protein B [Rickettsiales bacterium]|nr:disulfide bond formation protein B [Rickettsiales bacterium]|tara:strand:- start:92 stop:607 length:516 start_codon:yes stop_codon:yes gene_type:complete
MPHAFATLAQRPLALPMILMDLAILPLAVALTGQYVYGLHPCELCIWQRVPYVLLLVLGSVAALVHKRPHWIRRLLQAAVLLLIVEAGIAFYHVGVEQHWWASATGCSGGGASAGSLDELKAQIFAQPIVACDQPEFIFLGLSMAAWNLIYALGALVFTIGLERWYATARR